MEITTKIDWFSCTKKTAEVPKFPDGFSEDYVACQTSRGYESSLQYSDGRIVSYSARQGMYIQYGGKSLNVIPTDALTLISFHKKNGYKPTRIDLAIDCKDSGLSISSLYKSLQLNEAETKSKKYSIIDGSDGKTLYVGSRQSEAFLRVYDKAMESGVEGDWKRIEIEYKGDKAIEACQSILAAKSVNEFITGCIRSFCDFNNNKHWSKIMRAEKVLIKSDKQKSGDTRAWLMSQVANSIAKTYLQGDTEIIEDVMKEVASIINQSRR